MGLHSPLADSLLAVSLRFRTLGQTFNTPHIQMDGWMDHKPVSSQCLALPTPSAFLLRLQTPLSPSTTTISSLLCSSWGDLGLDPSSCLYPEIQSWDPDNSMSLERLLLDVCPVHQLLSTTVTSNSKSPSLSKTLFLTSSLLFVAKWTTHVTPLPLLLTV